MTIAPSTRHALLWTLIAGVGALLVWLLAPVLTPFVIAAMLAYVLAPAVQGLTRRRVPRALATVIVIVLLVLALLLLVLLVVPAFLRQIPLLREQVPQLATMLNQTLNGWLSPFGLAVQLDIETLRAWLMEHADTRAQGWIDALLNSARIGGSVALAVVGNAVLLPMVLFYLLYDWASIWARVWELVPPRMRESFGGFLFECDQMLGQYLRGQVLVMLLLAIFYSVGLMLVGLNLALPIGIFTGLAVFIPYVGYGLGLVLALLAGLLQFGGWQGLIGVGIVYALGQVIESFVLTPYLVGERIGMSPLMVIFALLMFGHLFGFVGVLLALPLSAVGVVAVKRLRTHYLASSLYGGNGP